MNLKKNLSAMQLLMLGLVVSFLWTSVASAAPVYRGKFTLPYEVRWGQTVLPAGDYRLRFVDIGTRVFAVIQDAKTSQDVALVAASSTDDAKGQSALLLANDGGQRVVHSFRLRELGMVFIYEPALVPSPREIEAAQTTYTLPVVATKE